MKHKKLLIFILLVFILFISDRLLNWSSFFAGGDGFSYFTSLVEENYSYAVIIYLLFTMFGCVVLALPGVTFAIIAGMMFGPFFGSLYCLIGTTVGAVLSFIVGRYFLKDSIEPVIRNNKYLNKLFFVNKPENEILILMITRILPIFPFNLQNFAYGITNIGILKYTIATFIFMAPGVMLFTLGTVGIIDESRRSTFFLASVIIALFILLLSLFIKKYSNKKDTSGGSGER